MEPVGRLVRSVWNAVTCRAHRGTAVARAVVVHTPSARYIGPGFELVDRAAAIEFPNAADAQRILDRHASEPLYVVVPVDDLVTAAA
jgi:hypothetical protein